MVCLRAAVCLVGLVAAVSAKPAVRGRALQQYYTYGSQGDDWTFGECESTIRQSPIDLRSEDVDVPPVGTKFEVVLNYRYANCSEVIISNSGHGVQYDCAELALLPGEEEVGGDGINGTDIAGEMIKQRSPLTAGFGGSYTNETFYRVLQFHFHAPAEHRVDGNQPALELHIVHQASDGSLMVLGIFYDVGREPDAFLQRLIDAGFPPANETMTYTDPLGLSLADEVARFLPTELPGLPLLAYHYKGSLTTPPCSEVVDWYVVRGTLTATRAQLDAFDDVLITEGEGNFRDVVNDQNVQDLYFTTVTTLF
ncbi:unnamed protein product [Vitrella brassicaformis CCMP3155]|uniref:carbonic anhydrase n=2 Tax=Vitrella brassicaformis TaxID=1169539 RepID=A0A0G4GGE7_VITBC|nr:unnamed protein product [Vitrella brassicaformis CCMP3155]|mmetsp:Transcript_52940/g.133232  ORF Transcript_52940/g.133232 Transcript_52940/m.133232 type:complete len:310 (+) Transcript_52940:196-1125(+)|eukprot:CEM28688.1 unnamed protein product [Vitrella brassicaformis CCMP3155]